MLKKAGMVTLGVTAGLMAAAPLASASESGHHGPPGECIGGVHNGDAEGLLAGVNAGNVLNIGNCSNILNGNLSHDTITVL